MDEGKHMARRCSTCAHDVDGSCHAHAPSLLAWQGEGGATWTRAAWPPVEDDDGCGDWSAGVAPRRRPAE